MATHCCYFPCSPRSVLFQKRLHRARTAVTRASYAVLRSLNVEFAFALPCMPSEPLWHVWNTLEHA